MANSSADFTNLSPFAGSKKTKASDGGGKGILLLGALGILATVGLVLCALMLKAS